MSNLHGFLNQIHNLSAPDKKFLTEQGPVNNGKIVAAIVDNDNATVKRFYTENNGVRLEPSNPNYKPIYTQNCQIAGIVVGLMRRI